MNTNTIVLFKALLVATLLVSCQKQEIEKDFTSYVDPYIGTGGHGHVFMGANVPFGFIQLGPTSIPQTWDWTSGYHISDTTVIGFSHTHLSGTGIGDLSDVLLMPVVGQPRLERGNEGEQNSGMWSYFTRSNERVAPGYYATFLDRYGIGVELTATKRVGFHQYHFPQSQQAAIIIDLNNGQCWDTPVEAELKKLDEQTIAGYRYSKGWANNQRVYFVARFSKPFKNIELFDAESNHTGDEIKARRVIGRVNFETESNETILVKVALSPVSIENANLNMQQELPDWDFNATREEARKRWNEELSKIAVEADDTTQRIFYTALYHTMIAPSEFCDVNGDYRGADAKIYENADFVNYTTFSLWDTYRAAHPLMTLIHPERMGDIINTMLHIYKQQGKLPVWHLMGCETDCMVGNPAIPVVADAILKGYTGFDKELAYEAMKTSAMLDERGLDLYKKYGYIPFDKHNESVAICMEYALADWALAQVAQCLGKEEDYNYFLKRSQAYRYYFDKESGLMRGLSSQGKFRTPFNPFESVHRENDYTEGNAWQYTWLVPHDVNGLVGRYGSREKFIEKLDSLFVVTGDLGEHASPDISGLIGQYAHGNEPSHHVAYLYTMVGEPWKTADKVREVLTTLYSDKPDGLSGNEDVGQMSAWYILSSLGFYQVEPAAGRYYFGSPIVNKATLSVADDREFKITVLGNSASNRYIQSVKLNGKPYRKAYLDFSDIVAGGELEITMGDQYALWYPIAMEYTSKRPIPEKRLFRSEAIEKEILRITAMLKNAKLRWMFENCFPNTLETTVHFRMIDDKPDTFVYTGDIHAMWLRDSGAQVWPYVQFANRDEVLRMMIAGVINRQFLSLTIDPYANAFNDGATGEGWQSDMTQMHPAVYERKWEIDSPCYPIRLAYHYWKTTGMTDVFSQVWIEAMEKIVKTFREQQRKNGEIPYEFLRETARQLDTKSNRGYGNPINPVGLIASAFRPSDDATTFEFLIPSNFFAVTSLRKAAEILDSVNNKSELARECRELADEVERALKNYATYEHPKYGTIYAFEVDGFGNQYLMDDANVPSLLAMGYLGDVEMDDPIYQNTRRFVWSKDNPYFFRGKAGEGIGGPHVGYDMIWPMSIMMKAFTAQNDEEIRNCLTMLLNTDAGTGFIHESFHKDDPTNFTREWFAWQNTLFGELIIKLVDQGKIDLLNTL